MIIVIENHQFNIKGFCVKFIFLFLSDLHFASENDKNVPFDKTKSFMKKNFK